MTLRKGQPPLWPYYCDASPGSGGISYLIKAFLSTLITGWIPSLLNAIWFGMLVPLVTYLCIQVRGYLKRRISVGVCGASHPISIPPLVFILSLIPTTLFIPKSIGASSSLGKLDREIAEWIWYFVAFNQFLGGVIGSTLASQIQALIRYGPIQGDKVSLLCQCQLCQSLKAVAERYSVYFHCPC